MIFRPDKHFLYVTPCKARITSSLEKARHKREEYFKSVYTFTLIFYSSFINVNEFPSITGLDGVSECVYKCIMRFS